jgi:hypothetical protein
MGNAKWTIVPLPELSAEKSLIVKQPFEKHPNKQKQRADRKRVS